MRLTRAEIHLTALRHNYAQIRNRVGPKVKIMGIVKANAYGHGILEVSQALVEYGVDYLGVGFLEEGVLLREQGIQIPILVLGGVLGSQIKDFLRYDLDITVASKEIAERIETETKSNGKKKAKVHLKIDTGMERIGVRAEHAVPFVEYVSRLSHIGVVGIYSHFATSDERDKSFAQEQLSRFLTLIQNLSSKGMKIPFVHMANSGAVLDLPDSYFTMVRPGIMMYGVYPSKETSESLPLHPVLSLKSNVVFVKEVPANTSISYGRRYYTKVKTRIVTVPIGYGDGYSRMLTNHTDVIIHGKKYPVVGTICMDQLMVDIGNESAIHVGDEVVLIGSDGNETILAWEIAERIGTIPYEVLTGITARVPRSVIN